MTSRAALAALLADPAVARALAVLDGDGEETRIVGGAVRNALIALPKTDVDMATTATPDVVMQRAKDAGLRCVPTGFEHGTVTVIVAGRPFEVTSLREDVETDGRRAKVRFGRDFDADARRRDFTINSMSLTRDGVLHDPLGGEADLRARRVRFIGEADARIAEDYLRVLRFFRFHAAYGEGPLDREGLAAAIRSRAGLERLSAERVRAEILKLLAARRGAEVAQEAAEAGLLEIAIAGVACSSRLARLAAIETEPRRTPSCALPPSQSSCAKTPTACATVCACRTPNTSDCMAPPPRSKHCMDAQARPLKPNWRNSSLRAARMLRATRWRWRMSIRALRRTTPAGWPLLPPRKHCAN